MGKAVSESADVAVVTSDNPRTEDPNQIIQDVIPGIRLGFEYYVEPDRRKAIAKALSIAQAGDTVLIAGKGHEPYQEIMGVKHPFSDQEVCREILRQN